MARKKKKRVGATHHRKTHHKVGEIKQGSMEWYALFGLGVLVGGVGGAYGVQALQTAFGTGAPAVAAPATVAVAGVLPVALGKGNPLMLGLGGGMLAVGGVMAANETFLNVPGISGMAFGSNASPASPVIRQAIGQRPGPFINQTVGYMGRKNPMMGAVISQ